MGHLRSRTALNESPPTSSIDETESPARIGGHRRRQPGRAAGAVPTVLSPPRRLGGGQNTGTQTVNVRLTSPLFAGIGIDQLIARPTKLGKPTIRYFA